MMSSELWARIVSTPRPHKLVDFPRVDSSGVPLAKLAIIVLTQEEQILASAETERYTKKAIKELPKVDDAKRGYDDVYNNRAAVEILFRACKQEDLSKSFFPSPDEIQRVLTADEVGVLFRAYLHTQEELGPVISRMTPEDVDAWIKRLQEAGSKIPLAFLSWDALSDLVISLVARQTSSATHNI